MPNPPTGVIVETGQPYLIPPGTEPLVCGLCGDKRAYLIFLPPAPCLKHVNPIPFCGVGCAQRLRDIFPAWEAHPATGRPWP